MAARQTKKETSKIRFADLCSQGMLTEEEDDAGGAAEVQGPAAAGGRPAALLLVRGEARLWGEGGTKETTDTAGEASSSCDTKPVASEGGGCFK